MNGGRRSISIDSGNNINISVKNVHQYEGKPRIHSNLKTSEPSLFHPVPSRPVPGRLFICKAAPSNVLPSSPRFKGPQKFSRPEFGAEDRSTLLELMGLPSHCICEKKSMLTLFPAILHCQMSIKALIVYMQPPFLYKSDPFVVRSAM